MFVPLCVSCGPPRDLPPEPRPAPERVWDVSLSDLMRTAPEYEGRLVRVRMPAGSYQISPGELSFASPVAGSPPAVVWECRETPPDNLKPVVLTGRVLPVVRDGHPRGSTVTHQVRLADTVCRVEERPAGR